MSLGLVGRKVGMTRVFADDGSAIPVTVLDVAGNRITQVKTPDTDGYAAVQVTFGKRRASRVVKPMAGHLARAGVEAGFVLKEFQVPTEDLAKFKPGDVVGVDTFEVGQLVDVTGTTKGRGFSGVFTCVMRLPATSSTVTGIALPSSAKTRVMPTVRPTNPRLIFALSWY